MGGAWSSTETDGDALDVVMEKSGLILCHHHAPGRTSACAAVAVGVGSRDEIQGEHGLAHVLEHLVFMGTRAFPGINDVSVALDRIGAQHNAFTAMDQTCYHVRLPARHLPLGIFVLAQMVLHPLLREQVLGKELAVVQQEIARDKDDAATHAEDVAYRTLFREHPTLSHSISGTADEVGGYSRTRVREFWRKHYRRPRMALVVCAPQSREQVYAWARRAFSETDATPGPPPPLPDLSPRVRLGAAPARPRARLVKEARDNLDQAHLCLLFPSAAAYAHRERYALKLLALILGGYSSSRLWRLIRESRGWAYAVSSQTLEMEDVTVLEVCMAVGARHARAALRATLGEVVRVARRGVTDQEVADAVGHAEGALAMRLESTHGAALFWADQLVHTHLRRAPHDRAPRAPPTPPMSAAEEVAVLRRVSAEDVRRAARAALACGAPTVVQVGPRSSVKPVE